MKVKIDDKAFPLTKVLRVGNVFDLKSMECGYIEPHDSKAFDTGVYIEFSKNTFGMLTANPNLNLKHKITLFGNSIIDDTKGSIAVRLFNYSDVPYWIERGTSIAHLIIMPIVEESIVVV